MGDGFMRLRVAVLAAVLGSTAGGFDKAWKEASCGTDKLAYKTTDYADMACSDGTYGLSSFLLSQHLCPSTELQYTYQCVKDNVLYPMGAQPPACVQKRSECRALPDIEFARPIACTGPTEVFSSLTIDYKTTPAGVPLQCGTPPVADPLQYSYTCCSYWGNGGAAVTDSFHATPCDKDLAPGLSVASLNRHAVSCRQPGRFLASLELVRDPTCPDPEKPLRYTYGCRGTVPLPGPTFKSSCASLVGKTMEALAEVSVECFVDANQGGTGLQSLSLLPADGSCGASANSRFQYNCHVNATHNLVDARACSNYYTECSKLKGVNFAYLGWGHQTLACPPGEVLSGFQMRGGVEACPNPEELLFQYSCCKEKTPLVSPMNFMTYTTQCKPPGTVETWAQHPVNCRELTGHHASFLRALSFTNDGCGPGADPLAAEQRLRVRCSVPVDALPCEAAWTGDRCEICPPEFQGRAGGCMLCAPGHVGYPDCATCGKYCMSLGKTVNASVTSPTDADYIADFGKIEIDSFQATQTEVEIYTGYRVGSGISAQVVDLPAGVSQQWDDATGKLTLTSTTDLDSKVWATLLESKLDVSYPVGMRSSLRIGYHVGDPRYSYATSTQHLYKYYETTAPTRDSDAWAFGSLNLHTLCDSKSYQGRTGYLATLTTADEVERVNKLIAANGAQANPVLLGATIERRETTEYHVYRWVTGPEGAFQGGFGRAFSKATGDAVEGEVTAWAAGQPAADHDSHVVALAGKWRSMLDVLCNKPAADQVDTSRNGEELVVLDWVGSRRHTADTCRAACCNNGFCVAWTLDPASGGRCHLKKTVGTDTVAAGFVSGLITHPVSVKLGYVCEYGGLHSDSPKRGVVGSGLIAVPCVCATDECVEPANAAVCTDVGQDCFDPDHGTADDWQCHCVAPAVAATTQVAVKSPANCDLDECLVSGTVCTNMGQTCSDADFKAADSWVCSCPPPSSDTAVAMAATCTYDECLADANADICTAANQKCEDQDIERPDSWQCNCVAPSVGSKKKGAASCQLDECVVHKQVCENSGQTCSDTNERTLDTWRCTCAPPSVGSKVAGPADCTLDECTTTAAIGACASPAQTCSDPNTAIQDDWLCTCNAPASGSAVGKAAVCLLNECDVQGCPTCANSTCADAMQSCVDEAPSTLGSWVCVCPNGVQKPQAPATCISTCPYDSIILQAGSNTRLALETVPPVATPCTPGALVNEGQLCYFAESTTGLDDVLCAAFKCSPAGEWQREAECAAYPNPIASVQCNSGGSGGTATPCQVSRTEGEAVLTVNAASANGVVVGSGVSISECSCGEGCGVTVTAAGGGAAFQITLPNTEFAGTRGVLCNVTLTGAPQLRSVAKKVMQVTVVAVNDPPTYESVVKQKTTVAVPVAGGKEAVHGSFVWLSGVRPGPSRAVDENGQTLTALCETVVSPSSVALAQVFSTAPSLAFAPLSDNAGVALNASNGTVVYTVRPDAPDASVQLSCRLRDSGGAEAAVAAPFTITVARIGVVAPTEDVLEKTFKSEVVRKDGGAQVAYTIEGPVAPFVAGAAGGDITFELVGPGEGGNDATVSSTTSVSARGVVVQVTRGPREVRVKYGTGEPLVTIRTTTKESDSTRGLLARARANADFLRATVAPDRRELQLSFQDSDFLAVAPDTEAVTVTMQPALFDLESGAGAVCSSGQCEHSLELEAESPELPSQEIIDATKNAIAAVVGASLGVVPSSPSAGTKAGFLGLSTRALLCPGDGPEKLDRTLNPLGLALGNGDFSEYNGATLGNIIILTLLVAVCGAVAAAIHRKYRYEAANHPYHTSQECRRYILTQARYGWLNIPFTFLYGGSSVAAATTIVYSSAGFKLLGCLLTAFVIGFPYWCYREARAATKFSSYKRLEKTRAEIGWVNYFFWGLGEWTPHGSDEEEEEGGDAKGQEAAVADTDDADAPDSAVRSSDESPMKADNVAGAGNRTLGGRYTRKTSSQLWCNFHHLAFDAFHPKWRYFLALELTLMCALACFTAWQPGSREGCWVRALCMTLVLFSFLMFLAIGRPYIAPYENVLEILIALTETVMLSFTIVAMSTDFPTEHWGAKTSDSLAFVAMYLIIIKFVLDSVIFVLDKWSDWKDEKGADVKKFLLYWFAFVGVAAEVRDFFRPPACDADTVDGSLTPAPGLLGQSFGDREMAELKLRSGSFASGGTPTVGPVPMIMKRSADLVATPLLSDGVDSSDDGLSLVELAGSHKAGRGAGTSAVSDRPSATLASPTRPTRQRAASTGMGISVSKTSGDPAGRYGGVLSPSAPVPPPGRGGKRKRGRTMVVPDASY